MTRAAILPAGSDPYLLAYWLRNYRTWANEVDELHIAVCGPFPDDVRRYMTNLCADVTSLSFLPRTAHGEVISYLLGKTQADYVMLCEDDAFVCRPEVVGESFRALEAGEVGLVATPRDGYATAEVIEAAKAKFSDSSAFWPCFVFVQRADLLRTDGDFGATVWSAGEKVEALDHVCETLNCSDTFVSASWQLKAQGHAMRLLDNYRVTGPFAWSDPPWFHVGSLAAGYGWTFMGDMPAKQYSSGDGALPEHHVEYEAGFRTLMADVGISQSEVDIRRVAWWQRVWDCWDGALPEHHVEYEAGFRTLMADVGISQSEVDIRRQQFDHLVTWTER